MSVYDSNAFGQRVSYAILCINRGTNSRHFDTCFEMGDGDAVVVGIYRRLQDKPEMLDKMWRKLNKDSVMASVAQHSAIPTRELHGLARTLRAG